MMASAENILEIGHLTKTFSGLVAVFDLEFSVRRGIIKAIIGPNGAGKTTLFNLISGLIPPDTGQILLNQSDITGLKPHQVAARGISRTFQTVELFKEMTVLQNVMVGRHIRTGSGVISSGLKLPGARAEERETIEKSLYFLNVVGLAGKASETAGGLPLGDQKLLEIARALATEPALLLLDEPAAGLNAVETETAARLIQTIRDSGTTVILVEHDMNLVMNVSEEVLVLEYGRKIADGKPETVRSNQDVINAYLGVDIEDA